MVTPTFAEVVKLAQPYVIRRRYIVGLRAVPGTPNVFDDLLCWIDEDRPETFLAVAATTDPGTYWLKNPSKVDGCAIVKPGFYPLLWGVGKHKGAYQALVQRRPVVVYRDNDRDIYAEPTSKTQIGLFGINLHRANSSAKSTYVDKWSAGCQVVADPKDFDAFLARAIAHPSFGSGTSGEFDYLLLERKS